MYLKYRLFNLIIIRTRTIFFNTFAKTGKSLWLVSLLHSKMAVFPLWMYERSVFTSIGLNRETAVWHQANTMLSLERFLWLMGSFWRTKQSIPYLHRFSQIYTNLHATIGNMDCNKDLKWWSSNHGVDMPMHWPTFEVSTWLKSLGYLWKCSVSLSLLHIIQAGGRGSSVGRARDSWWGGHGFDSCCGRPLPTGWVGVSIMWPAETEVMVSQLCLVCGST